MNEAKIEIEDVMRCLRYNSMLIDKFIGLSLPDDEDVNWYILELVGDDMTKCEKNLKNWFLEKVNENCLQTGTNERVKQINESHPQ